MAKPHLLDAKERLLTQLVAVVKELPNEQIAEVADFAGYLQSKHRSLDARPGSPQAVLGALERYGPLEFDEGELDTLMADVERLRNLELDENGGLSA